MYFFYFYLKYGLSAPFTMHVVFVFPDAYALVILESGNIFQQGVKCIRCCKWDIIVDHRHGHLYFRRSYL